MSREARRLLSGFAAAAWKKKKKKKAEKKHFVMNPRRRLLRCIGNETKVGEGGVHMEGHSPKLEGKLQS